MEGHCDLHVTAYSTRRSFLYCIIERYCSDQRNFKHAMNKWRRKSTSSEIIEYTVPWKHLEKSDRTTVEEMTLTLEAIKPEERKDRVVSRIRPAVHRKNCMHHALVQQKPAFRWCWKLASPHFIPDISSPFLCVVVQIGYSESILPSGFLRGSILTLYIVQSFETNWVGVRYLLLVHIFKSNWGILISL